MLEVKHLSKTYYTKGGLSVLALDDINITFPETGMIFLLGKSGSGKSTLLNLIGGLDKPSSGEIILKGKSSLEFSQQDFDSYRNTYVGFVFQEYNILNEFNVEENISLALELQKKPNNIKAINSLLEEVDLKGYNFRKPNTLSGGQKQRLAIARALIKNPNIIMADEPTGALDSNTGRQVLMTLKKLSEDKLVIVVSHDREFATQYGDRIIELKDGRIIKDVVKEYVDPDVISSSISSINNETILIKNTSSITDKDIDYIKKVIKSSDGEVVISTGAHNVDKVKTVSRITNDGRSEIFKDCNYNDDTFYKKEDVNLIKSKLPLRRAFKMGASSLKVKPFRLILTIILSLISFIMLGVSTTCMLYDSSYSLSDALKDSYYTSERISKSYYTTYRYLYIDYEEGTTTEEEPYRVSSETVFGKQELNELNNKYPSLDFCGIFNFSSGSSWYTPTFSLDNGSIANSDMAAMHPVESITGFTDCGKDYMDRNFTLKEGKYPTESNEIAISTYIYELYKYGGKYTINNYSDLIGKTIELNGSFGTNYQTIKLKVTGIYDVGVINEDFNEIINTSTKLKESDIENLKSTLRNYLSNSYLTLGYVTESFFDAYKSDLKYIQDTYIDSVYPDGLFIGTYKLDSVVESYYSYSSYITEKTVENKSNLFTFYDLYNAQTSFSLNNDECYIPIHCLYNSIEKTLKRFDSYYSLLKEVNTFEYNDSIYYINSSIYQDTKDTSQLSKIMNKFNQISNNEYYKTAEFNTNFNTIKEFLSNNYLDVLYKGLIINKALSYIEENEDELSETINSNLLNYINNPSEDSFNTLKNTITTYYQSFENESLLYKCIELSSETLLNQTQIGLYEKVLDETITDTELQTFKAEINALYKEYVQDENNTISSMVSSIFNGYDLDLSLFSYIDNIAVQAVYYKSYNGHSGTLNVKGYYSCDHTTDILVSSSFIDNESYKNSFEWKYIEETEYVMPEDARYNYLITKTDFSMEDIKVLTFDNNIIQYNLTNDIATSLTMYISIIKLLSSVFISVALVLGVFAALLLLNFITVSINNKKKDIGILRAVGARKQDVFKIFMSESFIISTICIILSIILSIALCNTLNNEFASSAIGIKLLNFNVLNALIIIVEAYLVAFIATIIPVLIHSKKPPVESIRAL